MKDKKKVFKCLKIKILLNHLCAKNVNKKYF